MDVEELKLLQDPQQPERLDAGSPRGLIAWNSLQYACASGDEALVAKLMSQETKSVNDPAQTSFGYTAVHVAVRFGHAGVLQQLIKAGASVNAADHVHHATPLHVAAMLGNESIIQVLLDAKPELSFAKGSVLPSMIAEHVGHNEKVVQLLRDYESRARNRSVMVKWLASIGLVEYAPVVFEAGFDDARFLLEIGELSDSTLDAMGVEKPGHRLKLQKLYQLAAIVDTEDRDSDDVEEDSDEESEGSDESANESGSEDENESDEAGNSASEDDEG